MRKAVQKQIIAVAAAGALTTAAADAIPASLSLTGDWSVKVATKAPDGKELAAELNVPPADIVEVKLERYETLRDFNPKAWGGWQKGIPLLGVRAQECTAKGALDPASLQVSGVDGTVFARGKDYDADLEWAGVGRLPEGRIKAGQPVLISYKYGRLRIDSVILAADGTIALRQGQPDITIPLPPELKTGETRLANIFIPWRIAKLTPECLYPILETAYPEPPKPSPTPAELLLPKTMAKLHGNGTLRILAWGDSVTDAGFLPNRATDCWQAQFVERLRQRFPKAKIELTTEAWGGHNTAHYLAEPPGSVHNYQEKVLDPKPDLIVSEFVNDGWMNPQQVTERYGKLLADFNAVGAEWIILTPHYVRPDWMHLTTLRDIDTDPRPYVAGLRDFAPANNIPLADASLRWGRLWRQGIPHNTLLHNAINHPDVRGMKLFADSLMELFP
jgi:lysophospholipase L1-like esterase